MVDTRPSPLFGQTVGEAQRALRALVDDVFDAAGTTFESWLVLNTLATQGPAIPGETLRRDLAYALSVPAGAVSDLLGQVESAGYIGISAGAGEQVSLTPEGVAFHRRLRESIAGASANALDGIDPRDIETTVSVLQKVKEQAQASRGRAAAA
jgi:DNA-binding MarR family transcriptional regulator